VALLTFCGVEKGVFRALFHRKKRQKVAFRFPERQKTLAKKLEDLQARQHKKSGLHGGVG